MIKSFQDIKVWQKAHELVLKIYKITKQFPEEEKYGLSSQLRRAAVSIASNIVEGFRRTTLKDRIHFYMIANGSLEETRYQILLSKDLTYIDETKYQDIIILTEEVSKMLNSWIKVQK
ncbi:MAG: four helix bundle protein [Patescibacteria group bacterium]|nr:four helix bundle protein [Patescibacteria group bacterium]MDD5164794.1 four helix bundle protein [Patescibacteria group bacterium]MDD5534784.1 four helix bundle protein [Patescibacteria group bacterium]